MDSACHRRAVRRFCARAQLVGWLGRAGGLVVVSVGLGTLGTGGDMLAVRVILQLSRYEVGAHLQLFAPLELVVLLHCLWVLLHVRIIRVVLLCALVLRQLCVLGPARRRSSVFACHAVDGFDAISQSAHHFVRVCDGGIGDAFVLELHSVG